MDITIKSGGGLRGSITVPGDKSISHRAVMFGALAQGITEVKGFLPGEDCLSTVSCIRQLGVEVEMLSRDWLKVHGCGLHGLTEPADVLNVGNSGTTIRLLSGILAGQPFYSVLNGDPTIRRRPMRRVTNPLQQMGAHIHGRDNANLAPLAIQGIPLHSIEYKSPVASAQVKSALLLAGLYADGTTTIEEPYISRDHSERMLRAFGAKIEQSGNAVTVYGDPALKGQTVEVPGDISSAAFFMVAGTICADSQIRINNVGLNPTRSGIIDVLQAMGADITVQNPQEAAGEARGDIIVKSARLNSVSVGGEMIPRLIDEIPVLAVAAAYAEGVTEIRDAAELKVKETNRISAVAAELAKMGVKVEELPDGLRIHGGHPLKGATVATYHDHRMAMAMSVAALAAEGPCVITDAEVADVSFPGFFEVLDNLRQA